MISSNYVVWPKIMHGIFCSVIWYLSQPQTLTIVPWLSWWTCHLGLLQSKLCVYHLINMQWGWLFLRNVCLFLLLILLHPLDLPDLILQVTVERLLMQHYAIITYSLYSLLSEFLETFRCVTEPCGSICIPHPNEGI